MFPPKSNNNHFPSGFCFHQKKKIYLKKIILVGNSKETRSDLDIGIYDHYFLSVLVCEVVINCTLKGM